MRAVLAVLVSLLAGSTAANLGLDEGEVCQDKGEPWYCMSQEKCPKEYKNSADICKFMAGDVVVCCPRQSRPTSTNQTSRWPTWNSPSTGGGDKQPVRTTTGSTIDGPIWEISYHSSSSKNKETQRPEGNRQTTTKPPKEKPPAPGYSQVSPGLSKSEKMCKQYGRYVYKNVTPPILFAGTESILEAYCGRQVTPLIVNGVDAAPREFPHMARIGYGEEPNIQWGCGGSLISERFILSAAHCTKPDDQRLASWANLGDLDTSKSDDDAEPITLRIIQRIDHPDYKSEGHYHDIALYKLERDAPLGIYIRPICLNTKNILKETSVIASGWGLTKWKRRGGTPSSMLQKVDLKLVPTPRCNNSYRVFIPKDLPDGIQEDYMVCAGSHNKSGTCKGDSGGPIQIARREPYCTYTVVGVTSFAKDCAIDEFPGVYTKVAYYVPWIESIVWPT